MTIIVRGRCAGALPGQKKQILRNGRNLSMVTNNDSTNDELIADKITMLETLKLWEAKIPAYVKNLTPEEAYLQGFGSGYKCKVAELEEKAHSMGFTFKFI
jgi:hypothetical protein